VKVKVEVGVSVEIIADVLVKVWVKVEVKVGVSVERGTDVLVKVEVKLLVKVAVGVQVGVKVAVGVEASVASCVNVGKGGLPIAGVVMPATKQKPAKDMAGSQLGKRFG